MHRAAVWQRSSNTNIKIVHKSIEHFLWNQSDLFFDDVLSCLWINFTNSVSQVPLQKIDRRVEILGLGWSGLLVWREMSLSHGKLCLRYSSVLFEKWGGTSFLEQNRTEQLNTSSKTSHGTDSFHVRPRSPKVSTRLREYLKDRVCENNPQTREGNYQKRNQIDFTRNAQYNCKQF